MDGNKVGEWDNFIIRNVGYNVDGKDMDGKDMDEGGILKPF